MIHRATLTVKVGLSKFKSVKIYFIPFLFIVFFSCQSVSQRNAADNQSQNIKQFQPLVEKSCFSEKIGSFFVNVSAPDIPTVSWEGKWTQNFSHFKTQILDPTGRVIEFNSLSKIIAKFGAHGLRSVMCGQTAFSPVLKLDGHKIVVKSKIDVFYTDDNQTVLETKSEFYYGLFSKKNTNTLFWRGRVWHEKIIPEFIRFGAGNDVLTFDFIDYE